MSGDGYKTLVGQAAREDWLGGSDPFGRSGVVHFSYFRKQKIVRGVCARRRVALRGEWISTWKRRIDCALLFVLKKKNRI